MTEQQYLETERAAELRSEYFDGEMFAMPRNNYQHCLLVGNLSGQLGLKLRASPCRILTNNLRVRTRTRGLYTYPDILAVCGKPEFIDGETDTLLNPKLIVEVTSKTTEARDRGLKLHEYRQIETLQQHVLVSQNSMRIEVYTKTSNGSWTPRAYEDAESLIELTSVKAQVKLGDVYTGVDLSA